jgi:hypothetical protein
MQHKTERQLICGKRKCRNALDAKHDFGRFHNPSEVSSSPVSPFRKPIKPGLFEQGKTERAKLWTVVAAGTPITANQYHCATVGAEEAIEAADRIKRHPERVRLAITALSGLSRLPMS